MQDHYLHCLLTLPIQLLAKHYDQKTHTAKHQSVHYLHDKKIKKDKVIDACTATYSSFNLPKIHSSFGYKSLTWHVAHNKKKTKSLVLFFFL